MIHNTAQENNDWAYLEIKARSEQDALNKLSKLVRLQASGGNVQINNLQMI